jgi:glycosyltransferase involved in cell wall biosynthesis
MRVIHIGKFYPPFCGGIENVNFDLVEGLNIKGIETDVLCFNFSNEVIKDFKSYNIFRCNYLFKIFSYPISIDLFFKLNKIINNYDIVHLHLPNPLASIAVQLSGYKGKIIIHWHSDIIKQNFFKLFYKPFQKNILKYASCIIVTSPNYLSGSKDLFYFREKIKIIPIGIDKNKFTQNLKLRLKLKNDYKGQKVIFTLGRHVYYKNFKTLINSAIFLDDNYTILIGGEGKLSKKLKKQVLDLKLDNKVKFLGNIPFSDLGEFYRLADVFTLPSNERSEAFGVVLIEAMSFGCPLVTCNIKDSGVPWVNQNDFTGLVVPINDPLKMADAIKIITSNVDKRLMYSSNSLHNYNRLFKKDKMITTVIKLYESLL